METISGEKLENRRRLLQITYRHKNYLQIAVRNYSLILNEGHFMSKDGMMYCDKNCL